MAAYDLIQLPELCVAASERLGEMGRQIARLRAIQLRRDSSMEVEKVGVL
jgi:hypothetical protein